MSLENNTIKKIVLCAGMPRSGSTWLYNVVRLTLELSGKEVGAGWIKKYNYLKNKEIIVLKTHEIVGRISQDLILYSYRDIRDVIASYKRQSGKNYTLEKIRRIISLDKYRRDKAKFCMRYEVMVKCPRSVIERIMDVLDIEGVSVYNIMDRMDRILYPDNNFKKVSYDELSLLHPKHITDGRIGVWMNDLDEKFINRIENEFRLWLKENGYRVRGNPCK